MNRRRAATTTKRPVRSAGRRSKPISAAVPVDPFCPVHGQYSTMARSAGFGRRPVGRPRKAGTVVRPRLANGRFAPLQRIGGYDSDDNFPTPKPTIPRRRKAGLAWTGLTGAVTIGGVKAGSCNFVNFKPNWQNVADKMNGIANALKKEAQDGCYLANPTIETKILEFAGILSTAAASCGPTVNNPQPSCKYGGRIAGQRLIRRRGGSPLSTGSIVIGGLKAGRCAFADVKDGWQNVAEKLQNLANAFAQESTDGCWKQNPDQRKALLTVSAGLSKLAQGCNETTCKTKR